MSANRSSPDPALGDLPVCKRIQAEATMTEAEEFTCEQQEDGRWFIFRKGQFFLACASERTAKEVIEILRKDAKAEKTP